MLRAPTACRSGVWTICALALVVPLACSDDAPHSAPATTSFVAATDVAGDELPPELQSAIVAHSAALIDNDPAGYWALLNHGCQEFHVNEPSWRDYFARARSGLETTAGLFATSTFSFADLQVDLPTTRADVESPDRVMVRYSVIAPDGTVIGTPEAAQPVLWLREVGNWKTTECAFENEAPLDSDGNALVIRTPNPQGPSGSEPADPAPVG